MLLKWPCNGFDWFSKILIDISMIINSFLKNIIHTGFDCPSAGPLGVCSNHGTCDDLIGTCICDIGFEGNVCLGNV